MRRLVSSGLLPAFFGWLVFLFLSLRVWPHVGLAVGEAFFASQAYQLLFQVINPTTLRLPCVHLGKWSIPVMFNPYIGPWVIYGLVPFVALGGCTLASLRLYTASWFFLALWGTWRLAKLVHKSDIAAFLSVLALAVCPSMATSCQIFLTSSPGIAASAWTLCFGASFLRTRKPLFAWLASGAFFLGLCSSPWVAGLGVGLALCLASQPRRWLSLLPERPRDRFKLLAGCALCAGFFLLPVLVYNAAYGGETFKFLAARLLAREPTSCDIGYGGCSNLHYFRNLRGSFQELAGLYDSGDYVPAGRPWYIAYAAFLLLSLLRAAREAWRERSLWSAPALLWIAAAGYLLSSAISPTNQLAIHLTPLAPILFTLTFYGLDWTTTGRRRLTCALAAAALCLAQFTGDLRLLTPEHLDIYYLSPLVIDVSRWAAERPRTPIVPLSVHFWIDVSYFSGNRARLLGNPFVLSVPPILKALLRRADHPLFVVENDIDNAAEAVQLKAAAAAAGVRLERVKVFADGKGRPAFEVYAAKPDPKRALLRRGKKGIPARA